MDADLSDLIWLLDHPGVLPRKRWDIIAALCHLLLLAIEELEDGNLSASRWRSWSREGEGHP